MVAYSRCGVTVMNIERLKQLQNMARLTQKAEATQNSGFIRFLQLPSPFHIIFTATNTSDAIYYIIKKQSSYIYDPDDGDRADVRNVSSQPNFDDS
jgi:hypothetical protein